MTEKANASYMKKQDGCKPRFCFAFYSHYEYVEMMKSYDISYNVHGSSPCKRGNEPQNWGTN